MYREYLYKNSYKSYNRENEIKDLKIGIENIEKKGNKTIDSSDILKNNINNVSNTNNVNSSAVTDNSNISSNKGIVEEIEKLKLENNYIDTSHDKEEKDETESVLPQGVTICGGYIKHSEKKRRI